MFKPILLLSILLVAPPQIAFVAHEGGDDESLLDADIAKAPGFAVVELFTSEGCSSCPPAESVLNDLAVEAAKENVRVFSLAFHVDYWDYLGWKDRYASDQHTARQKFYGKAMHLRSIYTPQAVVNGRVQFVGSNRDKIRGALVAALSKPPTVKIIINQAPVTPRGVAITVKLTGAPADAKVHVATVQSGLVSKVTAGENRGGTLRHNNVVRRFDTYTLKPDQTSIVHTIMPIQGADEKDVDTIVYVQDSRTLQILAAARR